MITKEDLVQAMLDLRNSIELSSKRLEKRMNHTDEQMKKTDEQLSHTDEKLNKLAKMVGGISNNQGDIAEELFWNTISSNPTLAGIQYDYASKNAHKKVGDIEDEYDILLVNGKDIAIIETKYKAHLKDLHKLITKKYDNFKKLYPEYKEYNHNLVLASFNINEDIKAEAIDNNVILLQRRGNLIEVIK
jgi:hypothetical protein